jgi:hypothetical protein
MGNCKMQIAKCKLQIQETRDSIDLSGRILRASNLQFAICILQFAMVLLTLFATVEVAFGRDSPEAEAPIVGRKEPFCGAVGSGRFQVSASATPTSVQAGDPISLTIHIQAAGTWKRAPERPDLQHKHEYAKWRERFHIENGPERLSSAEGKWEFDFLLRPKSERVSEIPSLVIVYYRPGFTPPEKGFMTTRAPAIPVQVSSRARVQASEVRGQSASREAPDRLYQIITGPGVLAHQEPVIFPDAWLFALLAVAAPALTIGWYLAWRRRNPTQARLSRLRKSRATRQTLRAFERRSHREPREEACDLAEVLADYLDERLDLKAAQSSPAEIACQLRNRGIADELASRAAGLFGACDEICFSPPRQQGAELNRLRAEAAELVLALESQP